VENYNLSLPSAPSRTILQIHLFRASAIFLHHQTQGYLKRDEWYLKRGNKGFLKLWGVQEAQEFRQTQSGSINYNINITSLLLLGLPMGVYLYFSKLVFSVGKQLDHGM